MTEEPGYHALFQRGVLLRQQRRFKESSEWFGQAIARDPHQAQAYAELALCYNDWGGHSNKALETIDRAISLEPNNARFMGLKAWIYVCQQRYGRALNTANDAVEMDPTCITALNAQANAFTKLRKWKQAEESARRILAFRVYDAPALNLLAQALRFQGKLKESRETINRILALLPNNAFGHMNAGYAAMEVGDTLRANEHFLTSLRMDPHSDLARVGLLHSLRSRVWIYRIHLRYMMFIRRPATVKRFFLLVTAVVAFIALYWLLEACETGLGVAILGSLWVLLVYLNFFSRITGNMFLVFDPVGRYALKLRDKIFAGMLAMVWACVLVGVIRGQHWALMTILTVFLGVFGFSIHYPQIRARWQQKPREYEPDATPGPV
jgi:tetratricopeptide (TPR) repeat protein